MFVLFLLLVPLPYTCGRHSKDCKMATARNLIGTSLSNIINYPNLGRNVQTVDDRGGGGERRVEKLCWGLKKGCLEGSRCAPLLLGYSAWTLTVYLFTQQFQRSLHHFYYIYKESIQRVPLLGSLKIYEIKQRSPIIQDWLTNWLVQLFENSPSFIRCAGKTVFR